MIILAQIEKIATEILDGMPGNLCYHNAEHTKRVVNDTRLIGRRSGLLPKELEWVQIAAWLHDLGYAQAYQEHEEVAAELAGVLLANLNMTKEEIRIIQGAIKATRLGKQPQNTIEAVLCDADLAYLAAPDFIDRSLLLRREWELALGRVFTNRNWWELNKRFLKSHKYFSHYGQQVLERKKRLSFKAINAQNPFNLPVQQKGVNGSEKKETPKRA